MHPALFSSTACVIRVFAIPGAHNIWACPNAGAFLGNKLKTLNSLCKLQSNLYITVTLGTWPGDRYIQGDRCTQVSFKLPVKSINNIFIRK